jgi:hypothetical protein
LLFFFVAFVLLIIFRGGWGWPHTICAIRIIISQWCNVNLVTRIFRGGRGRGEVHDQLGCVSQLLSRNVILSVFSLAKLLAKFR